ncbi:hypothetical protein PG995_006606 [Apiospora arundinis]
MEERGTEAESSGTQGAQFEASTSGKAIPDSQSERQPQISSKGKEPISPDSDVFQDAQHQLVLSLAKLVQNTIEQETKDLLRQIRDNSERQTILLKATLADSWCDPGQTAHIRAALSSQEPWTASYEALVGIQIGMNDQAVDEANISYPLKCLCHGFEGEFIADNIAMIIILAVWGFDNFINDRPESIASGLDALGDVMPPEKTHTVSETLDIFIASLARYCFWLHWSPQMTLRLKRGETHIRMKPSDAPFTNFIFGAVVRPTNKELANLVMQGWTRTLEPNLHTWPNMYCPRYGRYLEPLGDDDRGPEFGWIGIVKAPSAREGEYFMSLAAIAATISGTAVTSPGGPTFAKAQHAIHCLLLFTGPWKSIGNDFGPFSRIHHHDWYLPERQLEFHISGRLELDVLTVYHTIRVLSPIENEHNTVDEGIPLSRVVGLFAGSSDELNGANTRISMNLTEKRVSIWFATSASRSHPVFRGLCLTDSDAWCTSVSNMKEAGSRENRETNHGIRTCKWLGGISIYQRTLMVVLEVWNREWNKTLDSVDQVLNVRVSQSPRNSCLLMPLQDIFDSEKRAALMFESSSNNKFESSDRYFFVTELLRISAEWIKETVTDMRYPQEEVNGILQSLMNDATLYGKDPNSIDYINNASWKACADVIHDNWQVVSRTVKTYEDDLLGRIESKSQEVKSLRDGLFSATSVKEATKSTQINEYILVFTVMTIMYLPLGFVATLYGLDMFDFQMPGQTASFAITTVIVSLVTYLAAWGFLYEVRQQRKKKGFRDRFPDFTSWIQHTADSTKHVFGAGKSTGKATEFSGTYDIEVDIYDALPQKNSMCNRTKLLPGKRFPIGL